MSYGRVVRLPRTRQLMMFCDCEQDGYCQRYRRDMTGRFRQICAGINCDLGTAAAFREAWSKDVQGDAGVYHSPIPLLLKSDQAPGDVVAMTAAIYSLHRAHPGCYLTAVESPYPEVFAHNPDVVPVAPDMLPLQMHYPAIHRSNQRGIHFMQGWCEHLGAALGVEVPLLTNRPHLYFADPAPPVEDYWLVCSGGKNDFTNKLWGYEQYQKVISRLSGNVRFIQVGARVEDHLPLYMRLGKNLVGKTTLREMFDLCRLARGVLCGVSLLMHVAAALEKPAVVVAGGREPVQWNAYPYQHYLHTVGMLPCVSPQGERGGCWRGRTVALGDNPTLDRDLCQRPVDGRPECMTMIHPNQVADIILVYK